MKIVHSTVHHVVSHPTDNARTVKTKSWLQNDGPSAFVYLHDGCLEEAFFDDSVQVKGVRIPASEARALARWILENTEEEEEVQRA